MIGGETVPDAAKWWGSIRRRWRLWLMQNAANLRVTESARRLAGAVYRTTSAFPIAERFGLTAQMRRSVVSIGSNIAAGCGRSGNRELVRFLYYAMGSASELEFQALIASDLELLEPATSGSLLLEIVSVKKMLARLIKSLS